MYNVGDWRQEAKERCKDARTRVHVNLLNKEAELGMLIQEPSWAYNQSVLYIASLFEWFLQGPRFTIAKTNY